MQWAKAGRMRVTAESWLLMWNRGLDLLTSNPKQVADFNQWERLAKHAAVLVAGRNEVQSTEAAAILKQVVGDWSNGSASVASELDAAIFTQASNWSIVHLAVFNEALLAAREHSANDAAQQQQNESGPSSLDKLEQKQKELDLQVIEELELAYKSEVARIRNHLMSENEVQQLLKKRKESLHTERYNKSCKVAHMFWEQNIKIIEYNQEDTAYKLWKQLEAAMFASVTPTDAPRFLALANFRIPSSIPPWEYALTTALTGHIVNNTGDKDNVCAAILAPEYPASGRRNEDMNLVCKLQQERVST